MIEVTDHDCELIQEFIFKYSEINISNKDFSLIKAKVKKIAETLDIDNFNEYFVLIKNSKTHRKDIINAFTINETYFFREMEHFDFLKKLYRENPMLRIWSAAASTGAEAYSIAMLTDNRCEVLGTDINYDVVKQARIALYPNRFLTKIPEEYKRNYLLRGSQEYSDYFTVNKLKINRVKFKEHNLVNYDPNLGKFDVIFLRNVLIYFNQQTKQKVIDNIQHNLKDGGYLFISHTENLNDLNTYNLKKIQPAIFQRIK